MRLGLDQISSDYYRNIIHYTTLQTFMGIVGGTNSKSYYVYGSVNTQLLYLDPHLCQPYCGNIRNLTSYSTSAVNYLNIEDLSPTFALCFYLQRESDLKELQDTILPNPKLPLFEITEGIDITGEITLKSASDSDGDEWNLVDTE